MCVTICIYIIDYIYYIYIMDWTNRDGGGNFEL